ncbi:glycosyltransferase family 39 protein [Kineosporia succinea]|uniref:Mannosyltransferase n=1 Tax=Kineosporia succinea TaxID=84632 RepID=A0ABT9PET4_9ACTN|nr:glycosyltransferase family 39 protein [Kineosporia succinea]MDP9830495.1 mannosyltransferase [Kineosporia succinea]
MHRPGGGGAWLELVLGTRYLGLGMGVVSTVVLAWGLARTALWLDEGATVVAVQRPWADLWTLGEGAETPLLPYYVLLKGFGALVRAVVPAAQNHPEVLYRLPSVAVSVLAAWILAAWMGRFNPPRLVVVSGLVLLMCTGFSRYGQEARPYASVLFLAVVATVLWSVLSSDRRARWVILYALTVTAMMTMHTLSAGLVAAHGVAALVCLTGRRRWTAFGRTVVGGTLGVALAAPYAVITSRNGTGPTFIYPDLAAHDVLRIFVRLFTSGENPPLVIGPVLALALLGLVQVRPGPQAFMARLAACWALVPLVAMVPVIIVFPNLLVERYVLFVVPAFAVLAAFGVLLLADLARSVAARVAGVTFGAVTAGAVAVLLLVVTATLQSAPMRDIRTPGGHGEDVRPALAVAQRPEYRKLTIMVSSRNGSIVVGAYAPELEKRLAMQHIQREGTAIWPDNVSPVDVRAQMKGRREAILLQRVRNDEQCAMEHFPVPAAQIELCQPDLLKHMGFHVVKVETSGDNWTFALLRRSAGAAAAGR